jgi:hypothetical protein
VRLRIDRGQILEIEQLWAGGINAAAVPLLTTPRETLVNDIPPSERLSREVPLRAANSYFDALEGDNGRTAAFAPDCVLHENGYQTVNNPPPGGRMMPGPQIPTADTEQGRNALKTRMMTCTEQIDARLFAYMKHIRPRRALVIDQQKGWSRCTRSAYTTERGAARNRAIPRECCRIW